MLHVLPVVKLAHQVFCAHHACRVTSFIVVNMVLVHAHLAHIIRQLMIAALVELVSTILALLVQVAMSIIARVV